MSFPRLDDDPFPFDFSPDSFYFDFSDQFLSAFGYGNFRSAYGLLFSTWGLDIITVVAARSMGRTASIAERVVSTNPVGIVNF